MFCMFPVINIYKVLGHCHWIILLLKVNKSLSGIFKDTYFQEYLGLVLGKHLGNYVPLK